MLLLYQLQLHLIIVQALATEEWDVAEINKLNNSGEEDNILAKVRHFRHPSYGNSTA